mmetsp:Transcript_46162/g.76918  ORF Transcript_46162/g.76918 Transcript_46162/m.76918 type:complete len:549 (+) Transcript_46162:114-1760(+)
MVCVTRLNISSCMLQSGIRTSRSTIPASVRTWMSSPSVGLCTLGSSPVWAPAHAHLVVRTVTLPVVYQPRIATPARVSRGVVPTASSYTFSTSRSHSCSTTRRSAGTSLDSTPLDAQESREGNDLNTEESTALDEAKKHFHRELKVAALRVPAALTGKLMSQLRPHLLSYPRVHNVVKPGDCHAALSPPLLSSERLLLLRADYSQLTTSELPSEVQTKLTERPTEVQLVQYTVRLGYDFLQAEDVLGHLLPVGITVPSGHEEVGHIIHLNLRDEHELYRHLIAHVLLEKHAPRIRTVVNKTSATAGKYRVFGMEVLAGENNLETRVMENGIQFDIDYGQIYWNSKLSGERKVLVALFAPGEVLCDACAGVGPISIAAASRGCRVYANDLNPEAVVYLARNAKQNGHEETVESFNIDGGDFMRKCVAGGAGGFELPDHIVMNLPSHAIELLLPSLVGAFDPLVWHNRALPLVHVYCFSGAEDPEADAVARVCSALGLVNRSEDSTLQASALIEQQTRRVRNIAPGKHMIRATFRMPAAAAFRGKEQREL